tara:strand:+ start:84 stop:551 length:468 start_codon:yes stop_codon:yes gene_type:complete
MIVNTVYGEELVVESRKCYKCGEEKPLENFAIRIVGMVGPEYRNECKQCKGREVSTAAKLKKEYASIKPSIDDECIICQRTEREIKESGRFSQTRTARSVWTLDHNHETGEFRGWICNYCNMMLSRADDKPEVLRRGADYLENKITASYDGDLLT